MSEKLRGAVVELCGEEEEVVQRFGGQEVGVVGVDEGEEDTEEVDN